MERRRESRRNSTETHFKCIWLSEATETVLCCTTILFDFPMKCFMGNAFVISSFFIKFCGIQNLLDYCHVGRFHNELVLFVLCALKPFLPNAICGLIQNPRMDCSFYSNWRQNKSLTSLRNVPSDEEKEFLIVFGCCLAQRHKLNVKNNRFLHQLSSSNRTNAPFHFHSLFFTKISIFKIQRLTSTAHLWNIIDIAVDENRSFAMYMKRLDRAQDSNTNKNGGDDRDKTGKQNMPAANYYPIFRQ